MTRVEEFEAWILSKNEIVACAKYGSGIADKDYKIYFEKDFVFDPWNNCGNLFISKRGSCYTCVADGELFDVPYYKLPLDDKAFIGTADYLRNSVPSPVWIKDMIKLKDRYDDYISKNPHKIYSEDEILKMVKEYYIDLCFLRKKLEHAENLLYNRYLVSRSIEGVVFNLVRDYIFRIGKTGKYKGKDFEKVLAPGELYMATCYYGLDHLSLIRATERSLDQVRFFLIQMGVQCPPYLQ